MARPGSLLVLDRCLFNLVCADKKGYKLWGRRDRAPGFGSSVEGT